MCKKYISYLYFIIIIRLKFVNSCECSNKSHVHGHGNSSKTNLTDVYVEKIQLAFDYYSTTEANVDSMSEMSTQFNSITSNEVTTDPHESNTDPEENISYSEGSEMEGTETNVELNEDSASSVNETITEGNEKRTKNTKKTFMNRYETKKCQHFKKGASFDFRKMADVWQLAYYRLPNQLKCFKLHIKQVKKKDQRHYSKVYGSFNNTVHWNKCNLEIKSSDKPLDVTRRHFLQGAESEKGVMDNIIIDEEQCENTTYLTLHRENADQWLVIKNLLLMRDCENGDIVVFTRVPLEPRHDDVLDALSVFGEYKPNGTMACEDNTDNMWLRNEEKHNAEALT